MIKRTFALLLTATLGLAACVEEPAAPNDDCGASGLSSLIGQDRTALDGMKFKGPVRVLEPGSVMTMDYRSDRLNVELNDGGKIIRLYCS